MAFKRQLLKFGLLVALATLGVVVIISREPPAAHSAPGRDSLVQGARLYHLACMSCHGPNGNGRGLAPVVGVRAPALDRLDPRVFTETRLAAVIRSGTPPMPSFGAVLSRSDIKDIAAYVRSMEKTPHRVH